MTSATSEPLAAADQTVRISAELRPAEGRVMVTAQDEPVAEFLYGQELRETFRNWPVWLRKKLHEATDPTRNEADYKHRIGELEQELGSLVGASALARLVNAADPDPSAPAFLRSCRETSPERPTEITR